MSLSSQALQRWISLSSSAFLCPSPFTHFHSLPQCRSTGAACPAYTCPVSAPVMCPDGACVTSEALCLNISTGCPPNQVRCVVDGGCKASPLDCIVPGNLTATRCPLSYALCDDGSCAPSLAACALANGCPRTLPFKCWDNQCVVNTTQCTSPNLDFGACPANAPFRCVDGFCASSSRACPIIPKVQTVCTSADQPFLCANGACVDTPASCPPVRPCASSFSVTDLSQVDVAAVYRCPDGTCRRNSTLCGPLNTCPSALPYRCQDGRCAASVNMCIVNTLSSPFLGCPTNFTRCENGLCLANATECSAIKAVCRHFLVTASLTHSSSAGHWMS